MVGHLPQRPGHPRGARAMGSPAARKAAAPFPRRASRGSRREAPGAELLFPEAVGAPRLGRDRIPRGDPLGFQASHRRTWRGASSARNRASLRGRSFRRSPGQPSSRFRAHALAPLWSGSMYTSERSTRKGDLAIDRLATRLRSLPRPCLHRAADRMDVHRHRPLAK